MNSFTRFPNIYLQNPVCVLYSTHILHSYPYLWKVLVPAFTIPEMENGYMKAMESLSFWITSAAWFDQFT